MSPEQHFAYFNRLVMEPEGAVPEGVHDGETEPMEVDRIRNADPPTHPYGHPTVKLPTLVEQGLEDAGDVS